MENLPTFKCRGLTGKPWLNAQDRDSTLESTEEFGGSRRIALLLFIRLCRMTLPARNEHSAFRPFRAGAWPARGTGRHESPSGSMRQVAIVARDAEGGSQCRDHCGHDKQECNAGKRFAAPESRKTYELMR